MERGARRAWSILLVLVGLALVAFFGLLYGIADCAPACQARGERAPIYALVGGGLGLAAFGALLPRGPRRAGAWGAVAGGIVAFGWSLYALATGEGGSVWASAGAGLLALVVGASVLRRA